jgi:hypothetical protein
MTNSRIVTASIWLTSAKLLTSFIGLIATIMLARLLRPEDYGPGGAGHGDTRDRQRLKACVIYRKQSSPLAENTHPCSIGALEHSLKRNSSGASAWRQA